MTRWWEASSNPNSPEALAYRREQLSSARKEPVTGREAYLARLARGKRVLDIGSVDHLIGGTRDDPSLHALLCQVAAACRGVDVVAEGVVAMRNAGHDVVQADVLKPDFGSRVGGEWDLIVAGEVIEHLDYPAALLLNVRPLLVGGGRLTLTTPNPYCLRLVRAFLRGDVIENVDHVTYLFPSGVAELADRCGFILDRWRGARHDFGRSEPMRRRLADAAARWAFCPEAACSTLVYELVVDHDYDMTTCVSHAAKAK